MKSARARILQKVRPPVLSLVWPLCRLEYGTPIPWKVRTKISTDNLQATVVTHDGLFYVQRKRLADLDLEKRLPTIGFAKEQWEAGVLATYGPNVPTLYRRAGAFIDKILKGADPANLPVEQPTKFELLINLKTAKALGLTFSPTLLDRADELI